MRMIPHAPGVQMQPIPEDSIGIADVSDNEDETGPEKPDQRISIMSRDKRIACDEEFSDSEDEGDGRRDIRGHKRKRPRPEEDGASKDGEKGWLEYLYLSCSSVYCRPNHFFPICLPIVSNKSLEMNLHKPKMRQFCLLKLFQYFHIRPKGKMYHLRHVEDR